MEYTSGNGLQTQTVHTFTPEQDIALSTLLGLYDPQEALRLWSQIESPELQRQNAIASGRIKSTYGPASYMGSSYKMAQERLSNDYTRLQEASLAAKLREYATLRGQALQAVIQASPQQVLAYWPSTGVRSGGGSPGNYGGGGQGSLITDQTGSPSSNWVQGSTLPSSNINYSQSSNVRSNAISSLLDEPNYPASGWEGWSGSDITPSYNYAQDIVYEPGYYYPEEDEGVNWVNEQNSYF